MKDQEYYENLYKECEKLFGSTEREDILEFLIEKAEVASTVCMKDLNNMETMVNSEILSLEEIDKKIDRTELRIFALEDEIKAKKKMITKSLTLHKRLQIINSIESNYGFIVRQNQILNNLFSRRQKLLSSSKSLTIYLEKIRQYVNLYDWYLNFKHDRIPLGFTHSSPGSTCRNDPLSKYQDATQVELLYPHNQDNSTINFVKETLFPQATLYFQRGCLPRPRHFNDIKFKIQKEIEEEAIINQQLFGSRAWSDKTKGQNNAR